MTRSIVADQPAARLAAPMLRALACTASMFLLAPCLAAECSQEGAVAVRFMNQYLEYGKAVQDKRTAQKPAEWLRKNALVSPGFPRYYEATVKEGFKRDPELGWDADVILDAQDNPEQGFKLFQCSGTPGYVVLQGADWPDFKVTVKVVRSGKELKVDGAGIVNIPKRERARK